MEDWRGEDRIRSAAVGGAERRAQGLGSGAPVREADYRRCAGDGMTAAEAARALGVSREAVRQAGIRLGLTFQQGFVHKAGFLPRPVAEGEVQLGGRVDRRWGPMQPHDGGPCPVPQGTEVCVKLEFEPQVFRFLAGFADGDGPWLWDNWRAVNPADGLRWPRVVAYQVPKVQP